MNRFDFFIVGGGAAGICAALGARARLRGEGVPDSAFRIAIAERNDRLGIKIRISGGGKCNVTHAGDMRQVLSEGFLRASEQRFLKPAFFALSNETVLSWLRAKGVETYARENGRVFPRSGKASDVLAAFEAMLNESAVEVLLNAHVQDVRRDSSGFVLESSRGEFRADFLLIATGGVSYPKTGTTGDGLRFARKLGHSIIEPIAALAPIRFRQKPLSHLVGVSLRNVGLIAESERHKFFRRDDVLITHWGVSGPACLSISREVAEELRHASVRIFADLFPDETTETLDKTFVAFQTKRAAQFVRTFFEERLPNAIVPSLFEQADLALEQKWSVLPKSSRKRLVEASKKFFLGEAQEVPIERGEVSAGGVSLKEIDPKTMRSRLVEGLHFAGEALDVAGEVGGFNLQAAYSTGWLAGESVAKTFLAKLSRRCENLN
ncbi:MAG: aminoacetone oxidase family FAD-binding enzyme [Chloroherpetonaceae bacterium]|nr:aminoacetone oxidase family FAD-binding enzyme [Chloroherpetonaceae bacterium]